MKHLARSVAFVASVFLLSTTALTPAFADGMLGEKTKAEKVSPLDEALMNIQGEETKEEPVKITEPAPIVEEPAVETKAEVAPVPENREVQVQPNSSFFGLSVGLYDAFTHDEQAPAIAFQFEPGFRIAGILQPIFGGFITPQKTYMGYGGLGVPFNITDHVMMMPSVAVGGYHEGDGYDLDKSLVYRFGTELAYQFDDKSRLGLNAHIITNGESMRRQDRTETIMLTYTTPLDIFMPKGLSDGGEGGTSMTGEMNK